METSAVQLTIEKTNKKILDHHKTHWRSKDATDSAKYSGKVS